MSIRGLSTHSSLMFIFKVVKKKINSNISFEVNGKGLRNNGQLIPQKHNTDIMRRNIRSFGPKFFNKIAPDLKNTTKIGEFKLGVKRLLLEETNRVYKNNFFNLLSY